MVAPAVGGVVLVPFPFSDLSASKLRPALVVAASGSGDWICAQVTSNPYSDGKAIEVNDTDFQIGSLHRGSYIRPGKLFTANEVIFRRLVGILHDRKLNKVRSEIVQLIQGD